MKIVGASVQLAVPTIPLLVFKASAADLSRASQRAE
jgi:hypothetical protein